jgi:hypothetical protein
MNEGDSSGLLEASISVQPGKSIRRRDDREEIWIHKEFSEKAQYRAVLPTEENSLWIQRSSQGVSPNGLSGFNSDSASNLVERLPPVSG